MKVDNGTTNFAVYEDATEFYGMAEATLPEISQITEEVKGAGIAGAFNGAFVGHIEAMTLTLNFRSVTADAIKLAEPRNHQLDLRAAQQYWDNSAGKFIQQAVKHVLMVTPTKFAPGKLAPAASAEASGEYAATYFATYIDGKRSSKLILSISFTTSTEPTIWPTLERHLARHKPGGGSPPLGFPLPFSVFEPMKI